MAAWAPEYDAVLVEEAVALALHARPRAPYWRERSQVYDLADEDEKAREFARLARAEFEALRLGEPVDRALREQPLLAVAAGGCLVLPAASLRDEGAELFVAREDGAPVRRSIVIRLRARSFADPGALLSFLRHELYHVADMVDPAFGYDPFIDEPGEEPARIKLIVGRYRALWDAAIDGRLARQGRAPDAARSLRRREFAAAFPMLGEAGERAFLRWFDGPAPAHADLVAFARDPCQAVPPERGGPPDRRERAGGPSC
jgi:hypothetical protein